MVNIKLIGIATREVNKAPMQVHTQCQITDVGLAGNFFARLDKIQKSSRQVTILSHEQWDEAMAEVGQDLPWHVRRANLCLSGYSFSEKDIGGSLLIGRSVLLDITGELEPCPRMDEIYPGLQQALRSPFSGGVACRVSYPGTIYVGDGITRFN